MLQGIAKGQVAHAMRFGASRPISF